MLTLFLASLAAENNVHVVVVDDERDIVMIVEQILDGLPIAVHSFTDPLKALEFLKQNPCMVQLLITDYRMPRMSGLEFMKATRDLGETMRIVVMSAFEPTKREIESAKAELGVAHVVTKPFGPEKMLTAVKEQLSLLRGCAA
jgi:DNA-binding NtrC family response regulator